MKALASTVAVAFAITLSLFTLPILIGGNLSDQQFLVRALLLRAGLTLPLATCTPTASSTSSLQTCITNAARGDTISVPLGTYSTAVPITFPNQAGTFTGSNYTILQSASVGSLPLTRVSPADASNMPAITSTGSGVNLLSFDTGDSGWKVIGLHLTNNIASPTSGANITLNMVRIESASNIFFDRCVVHPKEHPTAATRYMTTGEYGFFIGQANHVTIQRSNVYDFFGRDPTGAKMAGMAVEQAISNISNANPAVITCTAACGVSTGDRVQVINAGGGLEGVFQAKPGGSTLADDQLVTSIDSTHFSLPVNTSALSVYAGSGANATFFRWPKILSITNANPAVFTVDGYTPVTGDFLRPHGIAGTLGSTLNDNDYTLTALSSTTFSIPVNTTALSAYSGSGGYFKSQATGQQTIAVGIDCNTDTIDILNNNLNAWYATMQTCGSDGTRQAPTMSTLKSSPTPTLATFALNSTAGLSVGMPITVSIPNDEDTSGVGGGSAHCPTHFAANGCWVVGLVSTLDTGTGLVTLSPQLVAKNENGLRVPAYVAPVAGAEAAWGGLMPQNINYNYNTLDIPDDFTEFHYATNGNTGKGIIEGKGCYNCTFDGNIAEGFPSSFGLTTTNQNCSSPWIQTSFITIRNNWFKKYRTGVLLSLTDYSCVCTQGHDITVTNNLFGEGVTTGDSIRVSGAAYNVTITHNTVVRKPHSAATAELIVAGPSNGSCPLCTGSTNYYPVDYPTGAVIRDNLMPSGFYTAICYRNVDAGTGSAYLNCFTSPTQDHNSFYFNFVGADPLFQFPGPTNATFASVTAVPFVGSNYNTLTDWAVQSGSTAHNSASDGADRGVNITTLAAALANNSGFSGAASIIHCSWSTSPRCQ